MFAPPTHQTPLVDPIFGTPAKRKPKTPRSNPPVSAPTPPASAPTPAPQPAVLRTGETQAAFKVGMKVQHKTCKDPTSKEGKLMGGVITATNSTHPWDVPKGTALVQWSHRIQAYYAEHPCYGNRGYGVPAGVDRIPLSCLEVMP